MQKIKNTARSRDKAANTLLTCQTRKNNAQLLRVRCRSSPAKLQLQPKKRQKIYRKGYKTARLESACPATSPCASGVALFPGKKARRQAKVCDNDKKRLPKNGSLPQKSCL